MKLEGKNILNLAVRHSNGVCYSQTCIESSSDRPNRSGSGTGSAELEGSVRFGYSAEPRSSVNRTKTEPNHFKNYYKDASFK